MKKLQTYVETPIGTMIDPIIKTASAFASKAITCGNTKAHFEYKTVRIIDATATIRLRWIETTGANIDSVIIEAESMTGIVMGYYGLINAVAAHGKGKSNVMAPHLHYDMPSVGGILGDITYKIRTDEFATAMLAPPSTEIAYDLDEIDFDGIDFNVIDDRYATAESDTVNDDDDEADNDK